MTEKPIIIRDADYSDMDRLTKLLEDLFALEADFEINPDKQVRGIKRMLDGCGKHRCIKVAVFYGLVIGMCSVQIVVSTAEGGHAGLVEDLVVKQDWRRQGIGTRLLGAISQWSETMGITRLQLLTDRNNQAALDFYKAISWQTTDLICLRQRLTTTQRTST